MAAVRNARMRVLGTCRSRSGLPAGERQANRPATFPVRWDRRHLTSTVRGAAAESGGQYAAGVLHALRAEASDAAPEEGAAQGVKVVEAGCASFGQAVIGTEGQFAADATHRAGAGGHHDRADALGDGIAGEDQHGPVTAGSGRPPDLASHHAWAGTPAW